MRYRQLNLGISILALCAATAAHAQSPKKTYTYDALGRLVKVQIENGQNDGKAREIEYDDAGNRKKYKATPNNPPPSSP